MVSYRVALGALCAALLGPTTGAQRSADAEPVARAPCFGMVRGADGTSWSGATVELVGRAWPAEPNCPVADVVHVVTDARGRFRAQIALGLSYDAWAWIAEPDGAYRSTAVRAGIVPRDPVVLDEPLRRSHRLRRMKFADPTARIELTGAEPAGLSFQLARTDGEHEFDVPPLPATPFRALVFAADGTLLADSRCVDIDRPDVTLEIAEAPRVPMRLAVRDIETGAGIADAAVFEERHGRQRQVGVTDADGCAELALLDGHSLFVRGKASALAGAQPIASAGGDADWKQLRDGFEPDRAAHLGVGVELAGRVVVGPEAPLAGAVVLAVEGGLHFFQKNSRALDWARSVVTTDAGGRIRMAGVLSEIPPDLYVVLSLDQRALLPAPWRDAWPVVPAPWLVAENAAGPVELGDCDLRRLVPIRIRVLAPDGAPALGAGLTIVRSRRSFQVPSPPRLSVDRTGSALVLVPRDRELILFAETDDGDMTIGQLSTGGAGSERPFELVVPVARSIAIRGSAVDAAGTPIEGVAFFVHPIHPRGVVMQPDSAAPAGDAAAPARFSPVHDFTALQAVEWGPPRSGGVSDADGNFVIRVPDLGFRWSVQGRGVSLEVDTSDGAPEPLKLVVSRAP